MVFSGRQITCAFSEDLSAVESSVLVLDLLKSSDSLSGEFSSSVAAPSSGGGAEGRVDLRVQLAPVVLGEDLDISGFLDLGIALSTVSVAVGCLDSIGPAGDLGHVSGVLSVVFNVEGGVGESLENSTQLKNR